MPLCFFLILRSLEECPVEEWLASIGLADRATAFREQGITTDQLDELTDDDLRELGLTIGERIRFRRGLAGLARASPPHLAAPGALTTSGERRPLSVMFIDLKDSTNLAERLDPEDLLEVISRYREFCAEAVKRFGGA